MNVKDGYELEATFDRKKLFRDVKRVVVKVGTRMLSHDNNLLDLAVIDRLMDQIADAGKLGVEVALVSSGAVGAGMGGMNLQKRPDDVNDLQALAAMGQSLLMHHYARAAARHHLHVAQVLLAGGEFSAKESYLHVQNTMRALFRMGAVPIINENDSVAVEELRYGDNDSLSAHVANLINADLLIIFTDIDGLYEGNPSTPDARLIRTVRAIDKQLESLCGGSGSATGIGGMQTKVRAAKMLAASGLPTVIAHGHQVTVEEVLRGEQVGTLFLPQEGKARGHYRWILAQKPSGVITVDDGASDALVRRSTSLLPSGVIRVDGDFSKGDAVSIQTERGTEIARGLVAYSCDECRAIAGSQSDEIISILGYTGGDEMIHKDNLVTVLNGV